MKREHYNRHRVKPHIVLENGYWYVYFRDGITGGDTVAEAWARFEQCKRDGGY